MSDSPLKDNTDTDEVSSKTTEDGTDNVSKTTDSTEVSIITVVGGLTQDEDFVSQLQTLQDRPDFMVNPRKNLLERIAGKYGRNNRKSSFDEVGIEMQEMTNNVTSSTVDETDFGKVNTQVRLTNDSRITVDLIGNRYYGPPPPPPSSPPLLALPPIPAPKSRAEMTEDELEENRETWERNTDFLLSIIGFAVDLANVWRFPYLCYRNGGGAFLIPYLLMLVFGAVPLFYMELVIGQYNRQGPITVWRICPIFKGIGFCAVMVAFYVSFYYNVIIGWALHFLMSSTGSELPWLHCNNTWNTELCTDSLTNYTSNLTRSEMINSVLPHSPASEYFYRVVLETQLSDGLHDIGYPRWEMVLCLLFVYIMLYLSLFKGVKSTGLVVWATATLPYVVLTILLVRGLMLPGALTGIIYYLKPELSRLKDTQVWIDAAVQVFYSVGAGFGVHLSYASYNDFYNNCYRDCMITTIVNCLTSFFSGFVIFTYLGYMSFKRGIPISLVATEGPGLVFQVYPEAVATLPGSHAWSILFFFMLIMLGIDSAMGGLECVITGVMDQFCLFFAKIKYARELFTLFIVSLSFTVALINVTPGGIYMFHLFDTYSAGISLLCSALFEAIAIAWVYGIERFCGDIELMMAYRPNRYMRFCWKFISPSFLLGVVIFGLIYHKPLQYNDYIYPQWAQWIGWGLAISSVCMIPIWACIQMIITPGPFMERLAFNISPTEEHDHMRRTKRYRRFRARHWLEF